MDKFLIWVKRRYAEQSAAFLQLAENGSMPVSTQKAHHLLDRISLLGVIRVHIKV